MNQILMVLCINQARGAFKFTYASQITLIVTSDKKISPALMIFRRQSNPSHRNRCHDDGYTYDDGLV